MKISRNDIFNLQSSVKNQTKVSNSNFKDILKTKDKNCDEIIISSKTKPVDSDDFAKTLSNKISDEVKTPASKEKLESLKNQIDNGTYKIDAEEIVKKIMLD